MFLVLRGQNVKKKGWAARLDYIPRFPVTSFLSLRVNAEYSSICFMRSTGYETTSVGLHNTCSADSLRRRLGS
jgi:hypothetical protein